MKKVFTLGELEQQDPNIFKNPKRSEQEEMRIEKSIKAKREQERKLYEEHPELLDNTEPENNDEPY